MLKTLNMSELNLKIKQLIIANNLTQEEFAKSLGVSRSVISQIVIGKLRPTLELVRKIAAVYEISYDDLLEVNAKTLANKLDSIDKSKKNIIVAEPPATYITKGIPLIPIEAVAGAAKGDLTALSVDSENYFIPDFNNKADFLIRVSGNSMAPKYYNGDIVACKQIPTATFIQWGKVYVLDTLQGAICKRLFEGSKKDTVKVVSENANYPPFEISLKTDVRSISIVVGVIRVE